MTFRADLLRDVAGPDGPVVDAVLDALVEDGLLLGPAGAAEPGASAPVPARKPSRGQRAALRPPGRASISRRDVAGWSGARLVAGEPMSDTKSRLSPTDGRPGRCYH
jgi:hypothetical protein